VILHSGRIMGMEVKSPDGALSREQQEFRVEWERAGGIYAVVRSVEQGRALLEAWGVVTGGELGIDKSEGKASAPTSLMV
jgi:hypothetical protein